MATYLENLTTERNNIQAKLADMSANPKPDYTENGRTVGWTELYAMLSQRQEALNKLIQAAQPFVVTMRLYS